MKDRPDASPLSVCGDVMGPHAQGGEIAKVCHLREKSADPGVKLVVKLLCKFSLFVYFKRLCLQQSDCCRVADEEVGVGCTSEQSVRSQHPHPALSPRPRRAPGWLAPQRGVLHQEGSGRPSVRSPGSPWSPWVTGVGRVRP